jgi:hypothetical protein
MDRIGSGVVAIYDLAVESCRVRHERVLLIIAYQRTALLWQQCLGRSG